MGDNTACAHRFLKFPLKDKQAFREGKMLSEKASMCHTTRKLDTIWGPWLSRLHTELRILYTDSWSWWESLLTWAHLGLVWCIIWRMYHFCFPSEMYRHFSTFLFFIIAPSHTHPFCLSLYLLVFHTFTLHC